MRIRQVRPEFWKDDVMADLPPEVRLFYIGLWCVADDAGWIEWNTATIAADLFPYAGRRGREGNVDRWASSLEGVGRIVRHGCGCVQIPKLPEHQKNGGNRVTTAWDRHLVHTSTDKSGPIPNDTDESARANNANATYTPTSLKGGVGGNGLPHLTPAVAAAWEEATGKTVLASGNFAITYLDDACARHPEAAIVGAITTARRGYDHIPSTQQLAAGVRAVLDPLPKGKEVEAVVSKVESQELERARQDRIRRQRVRGYWNTGIWDPSWGPEPTKGDTAA